jgi:hypothetical protein
VHCMFWCFFLVASFGAWLQLSTSAAFFVMICRESGEPQAFFLPHPVAALDHTTILWHCNILVNRNQRVSQCLCPMCARSVCFFPPSGCGLTAPHRECGLHLVDIPSVAEREKVYNSFMEDCERVWSTTTD